ncbi:MAG: cyclase family protein [Woeseiaceae bacterium]
MRVSLPGCLFVLAMVNQAVAFEPSDYTVIDLSHAYGESTLYWPTSPTTFRKDVLAYGDTDQGYFYSAYSVCTPEHGGTHIDAPVHFAKEGLSTDELPLENLIAPAVVIDVSAKAAADPTYRLSVADVNRFESSYGEIPAGTIVLMRTDWSTRWPDAMRYLGDDTPGDASNLKFPGFGAAATRLLVEERAVGMLGIDTASVDYGPSQDFIAHQIGAAQGIPNLENLTNLAALPATGSIIMALPMKIQGGSGGPVRVVALVPR